MDRPQRIHPGPGQESVWDYPRPPRVEPTDRRIRVEHRGRVLADTTQAVRVLETSQPPAYYVPRRDVATDLLVPSAQRSWCEWKGDATYFDVVVEGEVVPAAAWTYERPTAGFEALAGHLAFYPQVLDACWVDDEQVEPNPGGFYGGWITSHVVGPFKGAPGTAHW